jgi:hypothetical protein
MLPARSYDVVGPFATDRVRGSQRLQILHQVRLLLRRQM